MLLIKQINAIYETQLFNICLLMSMLMFYAKKVKALNMFTNLETKRTVNCLNMPCQEQQLSYDLKWIKMWRW